MPLRARFFALALVVSTVMWGKQPLTPTWVHTAGTVSASVVRLTYPMVGYDMWTGEEVAGDAVCSGFVIDATRHYVLTAEHCLNSGTAERLTVDGLSDVTVIWYDMKQDLAVLQIPSLQKPALAPRASNVVKADELAVLGFGYGLADTLFDHVWVSNVRQDFGDLEGEWLIVYGAFIAGQSGGPIFDLTGKVVGIVQRSDNITGLSLPQDDLWNATKDYWQSPRIKPGEAHQGAN